ncbi:polyphosphate kinase 2 family protein [Methyloceanibacter sp.]|uniref:polyphosphate kinase 2 family protein n=1 Tax=Methyloceanibacter sp. TaxID=1965321 RepID=UPI002C94EF88|nr:polyphosphate kinase 2 family protein [Methyloceanibacter sp.]HML90880.1 polyphosphate kinase 2 family protein [Methyloceanibacter sp.]
MLPTKILDRYRVTKGDNFKLKDYPPDDSGNVDFDKKDGQELLEVGVKRLSRLQQRLYAEGRWAVLMVLQGIDTAGKDGIIQHVLTGVNPQGVSVHSFKQPSHLELAHDFLWRAYRRLPMRGRIGIFNRSYYEDVLVVRVHPELLQNQNLPSTLITKDIWKERYQDINDFERHLARNGTVPIKFFLNISKKEQRERLLARLEDPDKMWKFSAADVAERRLWDKYQEVYEDMIRNTATEHAPWYVVPCNKKWFARLVVAAVLSDHIKTIDPSFPKMSNEDAAEIDAAHKELLDEKD